MCFKEEPLGAWRGAFYCRRNASTHWKCCWWLKLLQRRWVEKKRWMPYEYPDTVGRKWSFWQGYRKSKAECVSVLYVHPLWKTPEIVLTAHTVDSAATGFNNRLVCAAALPCMHGLFKRNEFLMRWESTTVVDIRRKRGFAICLEAGRHLQIVPRCKSCKSLNYAILGGVSRIPEPCPEQSDYFLSFFSTRLWRYLKMKDAWLCDECRSQHASKWPVRGTEQRRVDPITADSTAANVQELFTNSSQK